jgi:Flp pilus assembly protein TadG
MLVPAGFLILIMLAALAFDFSHLFLAQRSAASLAEAAANDAVTFGVDQGRLRAGDGVHLDQDRVNEAVAQAVSVGGPSLTILNVDAQIIDDTRVEVAITARIDYIFLKAVPGAPDSETVTARSEATATQTP